MSNKYRFCIFLLVLCISTAALAAPAPAWHGTGVDGKPIVFDPQHRQRPAILFFWATWCPYCEALMPFVQKVYDAAGKGKLDVYAIDIKEDGDPVATLRDRKITFTLVRDGDPIAPLYGVKGTPGLFLVDTHGEIIYQRSGGDEPAKVEAALRDKLGLPPPPAAK